MIKLLDILNESQPIKNLTPEEINNIPYFYHATSYINLGKIINQGLKVDKIEGVIYLTDDPKDALKFLYIRGIKDLIVIKLKASKLDKTKLYESFDHDYSFFKCRAYVYEKDIPMMNINLEWIKRYK
jgi:hypothetical protein